jgi:hypothetical protein
MKLVTYPEKKSSIRAIDKGTIYDVTGKLRSITRTIERGEEGHITDAIVIIRRDNGSIGSFHLGSGNRERTHHMVCTVQNRLEPA